MTTVGYGDFYPKTIMGRMVGYMAAFAGVALESMVVLTAQRVFILVGPHPPSYFMLEKLQRTKLLMKKAIYMITAQFKVKTASESQLKGALARHSQ